MMRTLKHLAAAALIFGTPAMAAAGEGLSKIVSNVSLEALDSLSPGMLLAGFVGTVFVVASLVQFGSHRAGKSLASPILLLLFGGALLSTTFVIGVSSQTITQGEVVNIDKLVK